MPRQHPMRLKLEAFFWATELATISTSSLQLALSKMTGEQDLALIAWMLGISKLHTMPGLIAGAPLTM